MAPRSSRWKSSRSQSWRPEIRTDMASEPALEATVSVADLDCMAEADAPRTDLHAAPEVRIFNKHLPLATVDVSLCPSTCSARSSRYSSQRCASVPEHHLPQMCGRYAQQQFPPESDVRVDCPNAPLSWMSADAWAKLEVSDSKVGMVGKAKSAFRGGRRRFTVPNAIKDAEWFGQGRGKCDGLDCKTLDVDVAGPSLVGDCLGPSHRTGCQSFAHSAGSKRVQGRMAKSTGWVTLRDGFRCAPRSENCGPASSNARRRSLVELCEEPPPVTFRVSL